MGHSFFNKIKNIDIFSSKIRETLGNDCLRFFSWWSVLGTSWVSFPVYGILYFLSYRKIALTLLAGEFVNHAILIPLRYSTKRARPTPFPEKQIILDTWNRFSFPSAHAARSSMIFVALSFLSSIPKPLLLLLPLSMGTTRLYLEKHYITDILAGFLLGGISAYVSVIIINI